MNNTPDNKKSPFRAPSARVTAALAAVMLGIGVAVGAAIGPAPSPSQADPSLPVLLGSLARIAANRAAQSATSAAEAPAATAEATPSRKRRKRKHASAEEASSAATTTPASETETTAPTSTTPSKTKASTLPPITHVWLIQLAGTSFAAAAAQPTAAPYIDTQAVPAGTLLSGWSALDGGAFANETALLASEPPQLLDTIVQPPCPAQSPEGEGAAGASCATEAGALSAADEFLKATVPTITSAADFRESGLIVVTFASVGDATATGLPAGAATATLTTQPPAGVLLISPFAAVGTHPSTAFNPTSPKQSLEKLLRR
ncbi:MAG: hypothetical protein ACLPUT_08630 [Solirubrobacteraceae bacterium]